jgi:hypothetical protein
LSKCKLWLSARFCQRSLSIRDWRTKQDESPHVGPQHHLCRYSISRMWKGAMTTTHGGIYLGSSCWAHLEKTRWDSSGKATCISLQNAPSFAMCRRDPLAAHHEFHTALCPPLQLFGNPRNVDILTRDTGRLETSVTTALQSQPRRSSFLLEELGRL